MKTKNINVTLDEIASDTGLYKAEISMALNAKRLLNREKLKKIYLANYPLEAFVFGKEFYLHKNDTKQSSTKTTTPNKAEVA